MAENPLVARLTDPEDRFVERKPANAGSSDFKQSIVAFANSLPANREGLLFVGIGDKGDIQGVQDPDKKQRDIRRLAENECHPPIYIDCEVLTVEGKSIVAVIVKASSDRPHFAGHAYVRAGSSSVKASTSLLNELIMTRNSKREYLHQWRGRSITLFAIGKRLGDATPIGSNHTEGGEFQIEEVTFFFVRFRSVGTAAAVSEPLVNLTVSWDDHYDRPKVYVQQALPRGA